MFVLERERELRKVRMKAGNAILYQSDAHKAHSVLYNGA